MSLFLLTGHLTVAGSLPIPGRGFVSAQPASLWDKGLISGNGTIGVNALLARCPDGRFEGNTVDQHQNWIRHLCRLEVESERQQRDFEIAPIGCGVLSAA